MRKRCDICELNTRISKKLIGKDGKVVVYLCSDCECYAVHMLEELEQSCRKEKPHTAEYQFCHQIK